MSANSPQIQKVLVIGGTGMLGAPVVEELSKAGYEISVGSRSESSVTRKFGNKYPFVSIDLTKKYSILKALESQDAIHLNLPSGPRYEDCFANETGGIRNLTEVLKESSVKRISYLSGTNIGPEQTFPPARAKWLAEESIRGCGIPFTIWRATWFMETLSKLVRGPFITIIGKGDTKAHWVSAADFGKWVAQSFKEPEAADKTFYVFGPKSVSFRDATEIFRDICYPFRPIVSSPGRLVSFMGKTTGNWEMWFGAQMHQFLEKEGEMGDPGEANELFKPLKTTIGDFSRRLL